MAFVFHDLDQRTRQLMLDEFKLALTQGSLYMSTRLSGAGMIGYPPALAAAMTGGTEATLATAIRAGGFLNQKETSHNKRGQPFPKDVPFDAHETLAEGEFNRFYIRALCLRAQQDGLTHLEIYRAKQVASPRSESRAKIGTMIAVDALLADLRTSTLVEPALGVPAGPNSGLSVRLPVKR